MIDMLAKRAGIIAVVADGQFGRFSSVPSDQMALWRYARTGTFSRTNDMFFESFFGDDEGTYLDIGANIGLTTVPIARNPRVKCIAFEADPSNFANLRDNVHRNAEHRNVELHEVALFDKKTTLRFGLADDGNPGDHRVLTRDSERRSIEVSAVPLDDIVHAMRGRVGAKIDVQGAEPFVISGGRATLAQVEALTIEFSPYHIAQLDGDVEIIMDYLSGFSRIASVSGDSDKEPIFGSTKDSIKALREFFQESKNDNELNQRFLDVFALR